MLADSFAQSPEPTRWILSNILEAWPPYTRFDRGNHL